jgi:hypothetical protein
MRDINLSVEDSDAFDGEIAMLNGETVLMIHAGIRIRADTFAGILSALNSADIDGLQPAAEVIGGEMPRVVPPLGGDPSFTLFEGATFTGGLVVRSEALKRARLGRSFALDSAFMGLADFCVTRGIEIWPYPIPVLERPENWSMDSTRRIPARLIAFDDCSSMDRYYMLAVGFGAGPEEQAGRQRRLVALAMINVGLLRVVRYGSWIWRRARKIRSSWTLGIGRHLGRILR